MGLIFGSAYDIIRMIHLWCGIATFSGENSDRKYGWLSFPAVFLLDACYMTAAAAAFSFFVFWSNNGRFRWYMAAGTVAGMVLYFRTVGKAVEAGMAVTVRTLKKLLALILLRPLKTGIRLTGKAVRAAVGLGAVLTVIPLRRLIVRIRAESRTAEVQKKLIRDVVFPELREERKRERR